MADEHVRYLDASKVIISSKSLVLRCLNNLDLLSSDAIIAIMVSEDLYLLGLEVRSITPLSAIDARKIARRALINNAAGVILAEVYRDARPWPSVNVESEVLQQELLNHGLALIDVLVFEKKHVRSRAFPDQT